jgi:hypothetical protein
MHSSILASTEVNQFHTTGVYYSDKQTKQQHNIKKVPTVEEHITLHA